MSDPEVLGNNYAVNTTLNKSNFSYITLKILTNSYIPLGHCKK